MISLINKQVNIINVGERFFLLGIFFLPFAFPVGAVFLLISLIFSFINNYKQILKDKWNYPLFISLGIILISTLNSAIINPPFELLKYEKSIIWINLFNWVPIIVGFCGFQPYLVTNNQKIRSSKFLLLGAIPVLISCILQFNFNIYGPFRILNGLIVWFQYPLINNNYGVTGLFNNQNYTACFFSIVLPFALFTLKRAKRNFNKYSLIIFNCLIIYFMFLTLSRNAFLCLFLISFYFFGIRRFLLIISSISIITFVLSFLGFINSFLISFFSVVNSNTFYSKFLELNTAPRTRIWHAAITLIQKRPILGWGASTFSHLFKFHNAQIKPPLKLFNSQHSHNLFLELAHNFGLPLAFIILITLIMLILKVINKIKLNFSNFDPLINETWLISSLLVLLYQTTDITYYDGKISLLICILLAGLRTILPETNFRKNF